MYQENSDKKPQKIGEMAGYMNHLKLAVNEVEKEQSKGEVHDGLNPDLMYYRVYVGVASYFKLSASETNTLFVIWTLQKNAKNETGWCYAGQTKLAKAVRVSVQSLNTILRQLEGRGLLEKGTRSHLHTVKWRLGAEAQDRVEYIEKHIESDRLEKAKYTKPF